MAHIEWNGVTLGTTEGFTFTPSEPRPDAASIEAPRAISLSVTFHIPDDAPLWRMPLIMAANAGDN